MALPNGTSRSSLKQLFDEQAPIAPSVFFNIPHYKNADTENVYLAKPLQIDYRIDCFNQTAIVNMVGIWKNTAGHNINCVFMLPMRGRITDCYINIGSERVRSVGLQNRMNALIAGQSYEFEEEKEKYSNADNNRKDGATPESEWDLMDDLFGTQICGYFRMPFDGVKPSQLVRVDLSYTETLQFQHNAYSLKIACAFTPHSLKTNKKWNDIMSITANLHVPPNAQHTVHSDSHTLQAEENTDHKLHFRARQAKKPQPLPRTKSADEEEEKASLTQSNAEHAKQANTYGCDFELQYYIISKNDKFAAHLVVNDDDDDNDHDDSKEDYISHHLLLTPPTGVNVGDRCVCFLLDRSWRSQFIWNDLIHALKHSLQRMDDNEAFVVVLFEEFYACEIWAASDANPHGLHPPTEQNKKNVFAWLVAHKPDSVKRAARSAPRTQQPFLKCLELLQHRKQRYSYLVVLTATYFTDDREIVRQMEQLPSAYYYDHGDTRLLRTRIFTVSYGYAVNAYLMRYLALRSRGKSIHVTDPRSVFKELVCFFNEFRSLLCTDIAVTLECGDETVTASVDNATMHPYPIVDVYHNHAVLIKLRVPRRRNADSGLAMSMSVRGVLAHNGQSIEFGVHYDKTQKYSFPMSVALAQSHLDALHAGIWMLHGSAACQQLEQIANAISGDTGLSSPTRLLTSVETVLLQANKHDRENEEKQVEDDRKSDAQEIKLSPLSLPPRTGKGGRGQNQKSSQKKKAAVIGSVIVFGAVATVTVINPFGGDDGVFGGVNDAADTLGECCGDTGCDDCDACCNSDLCVVL